MDRRIGIMALVIGITFIMASINLSYSESFENSNKVVIFAPHPDDETIGVGGFIQRLKNQGKDVHVVLVTSGNFVSDKVPLCNNYYGLNIPANVSPEERKKIIREDSFKRVMNIYGVSYEMIGQDDEKTTDQSVFDVMDRMRREGYTEFYTTTEENNSDHLHSANAMKLMMEKYPQLKYRQFPIYWHATNNGPDRYKPKPIVNNYIDYRAENFAGKLEAMQVYNNIQIFPLFKYNADVERIYYLN